MTRTEIEAWRDHDREKIGYKDMTDEDKEEFDEAFNSMLDQYLEEHNEIIEDEPGDSNDGDVPPDDDFSKTKDVQGRLSREINEQIDSKIERTESRQEFQEKYDKEDMEQLKESDPERYARVQAVNKMATREELDEANGGKTCWDDMSFDEMTEMKKTNPDRANALQQDWMDRHPRGTAENDQTQEMKQEARERQIAHKAERDKNDDIPSDLLESKNPYKHF